MNCAANADTNGVDLRPSGPTPAVQKPERKLAKAVIIDKAPGNAVGLPGQFVPNLPQTAGSTGVIKSYILPGNKTGVVSSHFEL